MGTAVIYLSPLESMMHICVRWFSSYIGFKHWTGQLLAGVHNSSRPSSNYVYGEIFSSSYPLRSFHKHVQTLTIPDASYFPLDLFGHKAL